MRGGMVCGGLFGWAVVGAAAGVGGGVGSRQAGMAGLRPNTAPPQRYDSQTQEQAGQAFGPSMVLACFGNHHGLGKRLHGFIGGGSCTYL